MLPGAPGRPQTLISTPRTPSPPLPGRPLPARRQLRVRPQLLRAPPRAQQVRMPSAFPRCLLLISLLLVLLAVVSCARRSCATPLFLQRHNKAANALPARAAAKEGAVDTPSVLAAVLGTAPRCARPAPIATRVVHCAFIKPLPPPPSHSRAGTAPRCARSAPTARAPSAFLVRRAPGACSLASAV